MLQAMLAPTVLLGSRECALLRPFPLDEKQNAESRERQVPRRTVGEADPSAARQAPTARTSAAA